nr:MAG TPA: MqsA [Caudoviricetes sp.]
MIEIIQNGKDKKYKTTCPKCDTDITFTKEDIKTRTREFEGMVTLTRENYGVLGLQTKYTRKTPYREKAEEYIVCPCCGEAMVISEHLTRFNKRVKVEEF